jgi:hypothetical protein
MDHPFAGTIAAMKDAQKSNGAGFSSLTIYQQWEWHADIWAFNMIVLGRDYSPCDPEGKWRVGNLDRIAMCERYYRGKHVEPGERARRAKTDDDQREGRAIINAWAQRKGYADVDAYCEAMGWVGEKEWINAYQEYDAEHSASMKHMPRAPNARWKGTAADLGVTAREYAPTPEQMAAGRQALGLEPLSGGRAA